MSWAGIKDVVFDRDVLIIKLLDEAQRRNVGNTVTETSISELVRDSAQQLDVLRRHSRIGRGGLASDDRVGSLVAEAACALDDTLANPDIIIDSTGFRVCLEDDTREIIYNLI